MAALEWRKGNGARWSFNSRFMFWRWNIEMRSFGVAVCPRFSSWETNNVVCFVNAREWSCKSSVTQTAYFLFNEGQLSRFRILKRIDSYSGLRKINSSFYFLLLRVGTVQNTNAVSKFFVFNSAFVINQCISDSICGDESCFYELGFGLDKHSCKGLGGNEQNLSTQE